MIIAFVTKKKIEQIVYKQYKLKVCADDDYKVVLGFICSNLFYILSAQYSHTCYAWCFAHKKCLQMMHLSVSADRALFFFDVASAINRLQPASAATSCTITWGWSISNWTDLQHIKEVQVGLRLFWDHVAFLLWHHLAIQMRVFRTSIWSKKVSVLYQAPTWN